jgi:uncharacterized protein (TIGR00730 family)
MKSICVYCGSGFGANPAYKEAAFALGEKIALAGNRLVYGGGSRGLMGAVAEGCFSKGGKVLGIIPEFLLQKEGSLHDNVIVPDMHSRKKMMFDESDMFIALPGGIGTLEELAEILTWAQLSRHKKRVILVNIAGFWNPLLTLMQHMRDEGFIREGFEVKPEVVNSLEELTFAQTASQSQPSIG